MAAFRTMAGGKIKLLLRHKINPYKQSLAYFHRRESFFPEPFYVYRRSVDRKDESKTEFVWFLYVENAKQINRQCAPFDTGHVELFFLHIKILSELFELINKENRIEMEECNPQRKKNRMQSIIILPCRA